MSTYLIRPMDLPAGDRRTVHVDVPIPFPTSAVTSELFVTENGKQWRLAGTDSSGGRLFVPAHLDPAKVLRLVWAREADLEDALGKLTPLVVSA